MTMRKSAAVLVLAATISASPSLEAVEECDAPPPILIDTDICAAVDDVAALAMANVMHSRGEARLLGVLVNTRGDAGAAAVDVVNTYYGHPDIPIGALQPTDASICEQYAHDYVGRLVERFPHDLAGGSAAPNAVRLYRKLLAAEKDRSVVILSLGAATNLSALLDSGPDEYSALSGAALVRAKVARMVMMGGQYPRIDAPEFNFALDPPGTRRVMRDWPTPIVFSGGESSVKVGKRASTQAPADSPVRAAFEIGFGAGIDNDVWDVLPVLYAVRGSRHFTAVRCGFNRISDDGSNQCVLASSANQHYLRFSDPSGRVTASIEDMLVDAP
ncbi:nucleoside hydrolase [Pendulispora brunnea]|uniref:Nucleoside hydrolase n=1 Tax=Pendulispora brunnea TaxID=2905690 RepID=A0ABZ2K5A3_9BACT